MAFENRLSGSSGESISVRVISDEKSFGEMGLVWDQLLQRSPDANVFLSHEWLHSWWIAYAPAARLCLIVVEMGGEVVGIAPMMLAKERAWGIGATVLRFIGDGTSETDHITFLADGRFYEDACLAMLTAIDGLRWDVAYFSHVPSTSQSARPISNFAASRGWIVSEERIGCPVTVLPGSFEELLGRMAPRFRTTLRSTRRKASEGHTVRFGEVMDREEIEPALVSLFANHASRWSAKGSQGVFADERKRGFYRCLSPRLLDRGWLRFYWLEIDGQVVAQQYCFQYGDTVMLLQEGFNYDFAKNNVGNLLRSLVYEKLIQQGAGAYDFLAGESRHKANWSNETRIDLKIECARRTVRGLFLAYVPRMLLYAKKLARAIGVRRPTQEAPSVP